MLAYYNQLLLEGKIKPDPAQTAVAEQLAKLADEIAAERPKTLFRKKSAKPRGLFIYGKVGRGKSMLMDAFFESVRITEKKRVHFHEFMQDVHAKLHEAREHEKGIDEVAAELAQGVKLLCFDEYEVNDVTDAMILSKLFRLMSDAGVVFVFTSNKRPEDHYKEGLQRSSYLEFCMYLQGQVNIVGLDAKRDYRMEHKMQSGNYFTPLGYESTQKLKEKFKSMSAEPVHVVTLEVQGRELKIRSSGRIAIAEFNELCAENLGNADYITIAERFEILFLENIPKMTEDYRNEARRFINLIDILYEHKTLLIVSADALPAALYSGSSGGF